MDYQKHYDLLINSRMNKTSFSEHLERHHIIPRCLGGTNAKQNLVLLTAREHYIAHWLLWKATRNPKLAWAFSAMSQTHKEQRRLTSRQFERSRTVKRTHTFETKQKISEANINKTVSVETREKISATSKGRQTRLGAKLSDETKLKISKGNKNKIVSEETKQKMRKPKSEIHKQNIKNNHSKNKNLYE